MAAAAERADFVPYGSTWSNRAYRGHKSGARGMYRGVEVNIVSNQMCAIGRL